MIIGMYKECLHSLNYFTVRNIMLRFRSVILSLVLFIGCGPRMSSIDNLRGLSRGGNVNAQHILGMNLYNGAGGAAKDRIEALMWLRRAADGGNREAQNDLGLILFSQSKPPSCDEARRYLLASAKQGYVKAFYNLGGWYESGYCGAPDSRKAIKWFKQAAEKGDSNSSLIVASAYRSGRAGEENEAEAAAWIRRALRQGVAKSSLKPLELQLLERHQ